MKNEHRSGRSAGVVAAVAACLGAATAQDAAAVELYRSASGDTTLTWDTSVSYGQAWRVEEQDCNLIGTANGGCGRSPNIDDGDLNYGKGLFSRALKGVTELSFTAPRYGAFVRAQGLYDSWATKTDRTRLSRPARDLVESYTRLLDAFGYVKFDLGSMPGEFRLGKQVISWGESTFIQGGINSINPVDVSALRVPGAEVKEAFLPEQAALFTLQINEAFSAQLLYLLKWHETKPEPAGSFFSTNDFGTPGGQKVVLGFGAFSDQGVDYRALGGPLIADFQNVKRLADRKARDDGQYGLNVKLFLPDFNNGTEFGLYFLNYHSRVPLISGRTGSQAGLGNAFGALNAVGAAAQALAGGLPINQAIGTAAALGVQRAALAGGSLDPALAQAYAAIGANTALARGDVATQASNIATHEYAKTAGYFIEYPEDIQMIGLSYNTQIQWGGIALQGELTFKKDVPLQYDDVELLFAALGPFEAGLAQLRGTPLPATCLPGAGSTIVRCNQLGAFGLNQEIRGWGLHDTWQFQSTATKTFSNVLKAAQAVLVFEGAVFHVNGFEDKFSGGPAGRGLRYNGPGTSVSGNAELASRHFGEIEPANRFPDATSWGYRLAGRLEYPGLVGAWNVIPRFSWQHDVKGTSPGPGGNFVDGRKALTLGVGANLRSTWELDLAYTEFSGAGRWNDLNDRDFVTASLKYSF